MMQTASPRIELMHAESAADIRRILQADDVPLGGMYFDSLSNLTLVYRQRDPSTLSPMLYAVETTLQNAVYESYNSGPILWPATGSTVAPFRPGFDFYIWKGTAKLSLYLIIILSIVSMVAGVLPRPWK